MPSIHSPEVVAGLSAVRSSRQRALAVRSGCPWTAFYQRQSGCHDARRGRRLCDPRKHSLQKRSCGACVAAPEGQCRLVWRCRKTTAAASFRQRLQTR